MAVLESSRRCKRIKKNGNRCKRPKIQGSKYCHTHCGFNPNNKSHRKRRVFDRIKTGKTSKILKAGPLVSRLIDEMKRNKDYLDIDENIAIMSTIMRKSLERAEQVGGLDGVLDSSKHLFQMLEKINRSLLTKSRIEEGLKHKIDIETIDIAMRQMMGILKEHIKNPMMLRKIADDFSNIRVHDLPMKGHKPRNEHLKNLEELNSDVEQMTAKVVEAVQKKKNKKKKKIKFEVD